MTAPERKRPAADVVATVILGLAAGIAAVGSVVFSAFFVMGTDSCGPNNCNEAKLWLAYAFTWGGVAVAALVGVIGTVRAGRRGQQLWVWPAAALALVVAAFALGVHFATSVAA